jgi:hypothetical protein
MSSLAYVVLGWAIVAAFGAALVKTWNAPRSDRSYQMPPWFIWGEVWWPGYRRIILPAGLMFLSWAITFTAGERIGPLVGLVGTIICVPLTVTVVLFNWPKRLVPPASRGEPGVLANRRARKRAGA